MIMANRQLVTQSEANWAPVPMLSSVEVLAPSEQAPSKPIGATARFDGAERLRQGAFIGASYMCQYYLSNLIEKHNKSRSSGFLLRIHWKC